MEVDDVSVREQLFHNRVRETIVSNVNVTPFQSYEDSNVNYPTKLAYLT